MRETWKHYIAGICIAIAAGGLVACAELMPITEQIETTIDRLDAALIGLTAAYIHACPIDGERPEFCEPFKVNLNRAVNARNELVPE